MNTHADKTQGNKNKAVADRTSEKRGSDESVFEFIDTRAETVTQRKLQAIANNSPQTTQLKSWQEIADNSPQVKHAAQLQAMVDNYAAVQDTPKTKNSAGLPDNLKTGIESLSGYSMDDVNVHFNSPKPAQLQARAYAQGMDIHLAAGQEKHLPHEAWHVVQQKQGRVKSTRQMQNAAINGSSGITAGSLTS